MFKELMSLFFKRKNYTPNEKNEYKKERASTLQIIHNEPNHTTQLFTIFKHVIKHAKLNPCFIFKINDKKKEYYLQCSAAPSELWCEVVSNEYLSDTAKLNQQQIDQILTIGWKEDNNYGMSWSLDGEYDLNKIVATCIETLKVYGLSDNHTITIDTFI